MTLYLDTSALLKLYLDERDADTAERILESDLHWASAAHTEVEVVRNLCRTLDGAELGRIRRLFDTDWAEMYVLELDEHTCGVAADLACATGAKTLDALHLAAYARATSERMSFVTFDRTLAGHARSLGWTVLGA